MKDRSKPTDPQSPDRSSPAMTTENITTLIHESIQQNRRVAKKALTAYRAGSAKATSKLEEGFPSLMKQQPAATIDAKVRGKLIAAQQEFHSLIGKGVDKVV